MAPSSSPRRSSGRQSTELNFRFTTLSLALNSASCSASSMRKGSLVASTRLTMVSLSRSTASARFSRWKLRALRICGAPSSMWSTKPLSARTTSMSESSSSVSAASRPGSLASCRANSASLEVASEAGSRAPSLCTSLGVGSRSAAWKTSWVAPSCSVSPSARTCWPRFLPLIKRLAPESAVAVKTFPSNWMATTPRRSGTRRSLSAAAATVVSGFTSGKKEGAEPSMCTTSVAMSAGPGGLEESIGQHFFGLVVHGGVDGAAGPERVEERRAHPLDDVETLRRQVGRAGALVAELAGGAVAQPLDQERAAAAGGAGDHLRDGERDAQRPVAVLELPDAEGHHRHPELALHHAALDVGLQREQPPAVLFQIGLAALLGLLGGGLLLRILFGMFLRAQRRQVLLLLFLHRVEEGDRRGRVIEGVELRVGFEVEVLAKGAVRLALAPLVEEGEPEQLVSLGAQRGRFEAARLHQLREELCGLRVIAVLEGHAGAVHRLHRGGRFFFFRGRGLRQKQREKEGDHGVPFA